jgi:hypothetical protein
MVIIARSVFWLLVLTIFCLVARRSSAEDFLSSALAHLGDTPDQIKSQFGDPTTILGPGDAPAPAEIAYWYVVTGRRFSVAFYFVDGTCGEIRVIRSSHSEPFTMEDLQADFEEYTGVKSDGCSTVDESDLKSIVSTEQKCLARTVDPTTLYIEDFRYFAYEVKQTLGATR